MPVDATAAWLEAAVCAPKDDVMLTTLEFHHPAFLVGGVETAVRVVRNTEDVTLRLDAGAPLNAGQLVTFTAVPFRIDYPRIGNLGAECPLTVDNVNRELSQYLEAASMMNSPIRAIHRGYLASDPDTVGEGPFTLELRNAKIKGVSLQGNLVVASPGNLKFLRKLYDMVSYPSLMAVS